MKKTDKFPATVSEEGVSAKIRKVAQAKGRKIITLSLWNTSFEQTQTGVVVGFAGSQNIRFCSFHFVDHRL